MSSSKNWKEIFLEGQRNYEIDLRKESRKDDVKILHKIVNDLLIEESKVRESNKRNFNFNVESPALIGKTDDLNIEEKDFLKLNISTSQEELINNNKNSVFINLFSTKYSSKLINILYNEGLSLYKSGFTPIFFVLINNCTGKTTKKYCESKLNKFPSFFIELLELKTKKKSNYENIGYTALHKIRSKISKERDLWNYYVISLDEDIDFLENGIFPKVITKVNSLETIISGLPIPIIESSQFSRYKDTFREVKVMKKLNKPKSMIYGAFHSYKYEGQNLTLDPNLTYDQQLSYIYGRKNQGFSYFDFAFFHPEKESISSWINRKKENTINRKIFYQNLNQLETFQNNEYKNIEWNINLLNTALEFYTEKNLVIGSFFLNKYVRRALSKF
jgi:hypothetical protein